MDLIPLQHEISDEAEAAWTLAALYEGAGLTTQATILKGECVLKVCEENRIPVIAGHRRNIYRWKGHDWSLKTLPETKTIVPVHVLKQLASLEDKAGMYIAFPWKRIPDPVLFYRLPYQDNKWLYIELARWE